MKKINHNLPDPPPDEGYVWHDCCCAEIDPADVPCIVCCDKDAKREELGLPTEYDWSEEE
jgi:hypothetical protein